MTKTILPDGSLDPAADFEDDGGTPDYRARRAEAYRTPKYAPLNVARQPNFVMRWIKRTPLLHIVGWIIFIPVFFFSASVSTLLFAYNFNIEPIGGLAIFLALFVPCARLIIRRRRPRSGAERY